MEDYRNISDEELDSIIELVEEENEDPETYMNLYYNEILFIGGSLSITDNLLNAGIFGIKLCIRYYSLKGNLRRVSKLNIILRSILHPKKYSINSKIVEDIVISLN
jgi:hypothetical protein